MEMHFQVSRRSEPLKKAIGVAKQHSGHQKISTFSAYKAQVSQYEIRIAVFKQNKYTCFQPFLHIFLAYFCLLGKWS